MTENFKLLLGCDEMTGDITWQLTCLSGYKFSCVTIHAINADTRVTHQPGTLP